MATPEEMLEQALKDTIEAIEDAAEVEIGGDDIEAEVLESARKAWRDRYTTTFTEAIKNGRVWKEDKRAVLERAAEVGRLTTYIAVIMAVIEECVRAGVGTKKGQDVSLKGTAKPTIDAVIANCGALFIDCDMSKLGPTWDWCPKPSKNALSEAMVLILARFTSQHGSTGGVEQFRAALTPKSD